MNPLCPRCNKELSNLKCSTAWWCNKCKCFQTVDNIEQENRLKRVKLFEVTKITEENKETLSDKADFFGGNPLETLNSKDCTHAFVEYKIKECKQR